MSAKGIDKNSIIGLVLIGAILLIFSILTRPTEEEANAQKQKDELAKTDKIPVVKDSASFNNVVADTNINVVQKTLTSEELQRQDSINKQNSAAIFCNFSSLTCSCLRSSSHSRNGIPACFLSFTLFLISFFSISNK